MEIELRLKKIPVPFGAASCRMATDRAEAIELARDLIEQQIPKLAAYGGIPAATRLLGNWCTVTVIPPDAVEKVVTGTPNAVSRVSLRHRSGKGPQFIGLVLGALLGLSGCALLINTHVDDLKISGVSAVRADDAPHDERGWQPQGTRKVLLVSLLTSRDIGQTAAERDLDNLHADIGFCGTPDKAAWSRVYQAGRELGPFLDPVERERLASGAPSTTLYSYQIWFDYRTLLHRAGGGYVDYDLSTDPRDLCVVVGGTPYMAIGTGLVTNPAVIPKQAIIAALVAN